LFKKSKKKREKGKRERGKREKGYRVLPAPHTTENRGTVGVVVAAVVAGRKAERQQLG
jgi:hypothetical protein